LEQALTFRISRHPEGTFGEKIRKFRLEKGLRQKDLAIMLGVNELTIVNWELDRRKPAKRHAERLRELAGVGI
jgi:transcriptional regulator with XRE-family HTH domain